MPYRAALLLLTVLAVLPATAQARPRLELGLQDDPVFVRDPFAFGGAGPNPLVSRTAGFAAARRLGVRTLRVNLYWHRVEREDGQLDLSLYDAAVAEAEAAGLRVQMTLTGPAPGGRVPDPKAYARLCAAVAAHYAGRVGTYSLWNEPNWLRSLPMRRRAARYGSLYRAGFAAIRRTDPEARLLFGELAPLGRPEAAVPPLRFLRRLLRATDERIVADGFAMHPYTLRWEPGFPGTTRDDVTTGSLKRLVRVLRAEARRGRLSRPDGSPLPIHLTEWGFHAHYRRTAEPRRSRYVRRGLALAAAVPQVRQIVWYQLVAPPRPADGEHLWDTALLDRAGHPRPAFTAVARWMSRHTRRTR